MNNLPEEKINLFQKIAFAPVVGLAKAWVGWEQIMYERRKQVSLKKYQEVMDWVKKQNLPLDSARELKLPFYLAGITHRGKVSALHTDDARHYILMKTWISPGGKNFYATFYEEKETGFTGEEKVSGTWV
ncbi:MAG TPA: hypothetical protein DC064_26750 [Cyanobacteria bacterium UBA9273]|nr:hypothetical protein [Cyanobacteria bacterium UBA9273]